jgi:hypothetical protein
VGACEENNELKAQPRPVIWVTLDRWSLLHRRLSCAYYDRCLTRAAKESWIGWSCCECLVRKDTPKNNGDNEISMQGLCEVDECWDEGYRRRARPSGG